MWFRELDGTNRKCSLSIKSTCEDYSFPQRITFPLSLQPPPILLEIYISMLGEELFTESYPCHSHKLDCGTPGDPRARNVNCVSASLYQACFETFSVDSRHRGSDLALEARLHNADFTFADVSSYRATV
jgi:hypothetical protein